MELKQTEIAGAEVTQLEDALRLLDLNINVNWPLQHYKTAVRYLSKKPSDIPATGGTNWQKYLPPRFSVAFSTLNYGQKSNVQNGVRAG